MSGYHSMPLMSGKVPTQCYSACHHKMRPCNVLSWFNCTIWSHACRVSSAKQWLAILTHFTPCRYGCNEYVVFKYQIIQFVFLYLLELSVTWMRWTHQYLLLNPLIIMMFVLFWLGLYFVCLFVCLFVLFSRMCILAIDIINGNSCNGFVLPHKKSLPHPISRTYNAIWRLWPTTWWVCHPWLSDICSDQVPLLLTWINFTPSMK